MLPLCVVMLKSPVCTKKPKPQKTPQQGEGWNGVDLLRCSHCWKRRKKGNPASLLCSGPQAMQEAGPQDSLRFSSLGLDGNQNSLLGRNIWKRH